MFNKHYPKCGECRHYCEEKGLCHKLCIDVSRYFYCKFFQFKKIPDNLDYEFSRAMEILYKEKD